MAASPPRRLLVLANKTPGLAPNQRFRFEQWAPRLKRDHNITLDLIPFESPGLSKILTKPGHSLSKAAWVSYDFLRRAKVLIAARRYDAVLVVREAALIGPAVYERLAAWLGAKIIFDFDDAIWMPQPGSNLAARLHFHGKTGTICRLAAAVTAGNDYLADFASRFNDTVFVVPTSIELDDYPVVPEPPQDPRFIVCWTGSTSTLRHFEYAREALQTVAARLPLTVKIICNEPPATPIAGAKTVFVRWSAEAEAREIGNSHAGIMPLPDDAFARGKCGLKALQSMATGRPVVLSPVGMNTELVRSGENGVLAATTDDYVAALEALANDPDLRLRMGKAARATVERTYSAECAAVRFARAVRSVTD